MVPPSSSHDMPPSRHSSKTSQFVSFLLYVLVGWALDPGLIGWFRQLRVACSLSRSSIFNSFDWGLPHCWAFGARGNCAGSNSQREQVVTQDNILFSTFDSVVSPTLSMMSLYCKSVPYFQFYNLSIQDRMVDI